MPPQFASVGLGREETLLAGGRPAPSDAFIAVATAIVITPLVEFGFDVADKTMCGSVVVSLHWALASTSTGGWLTYRA
eukprot:2989087-Prymnesium_polylepis.2